MSLYQFILYFFVYGFLGWCTEVAYAACKSGKFVNRGFLNGPICPIYGVGVCVVVMFLTPYKTSIFLLYVSSTLLVTILEGVTGFAMDKIFHNKWWDYSAQPLNIGGYVCLLFSLIWGVACVLIVDLIHPLISGVLAHIPFLAGVVILVPLGIALFADAYVTSAAIFKMNKRLASMDKIARELHELSDQIGEGIFTQMNATKEAREGAAEVIGETREKFGETKERIGETLEATFERLDEANQERREKRQERNMESALEREKTIASLKASYQELAEKSTVVTRRLVKAFSKMKSRKNDEQLQSWRKYLILKKK